MLDKQDLQKLYKYAFSLVKDEDMAYDLLQTGIERTLNRNMTAIDEPIAYTKVIMRNVFFDEQRRKKIVPMISIEQDEEQYDNEDESLSLEDIHIHLDDIEQITEMLTPAENELLYLWAVEEYTAEEISKLLTQPRGTVLSKLHRLKHRIRQSINN